VAIQREAHSMPDAAVCRVAGAKKSIERCDKSACALFERISAHAGFGRLFEWAAGVDVETAAVIRALHGFAFNTAEVQRHIVVRAEVVHQSQLAGFGANQEQIAALNDDPLEVAWREFVGIANVDLSHAYIPT
jgi:hypothetical protein